MTNGWFPRYSPDGSRLTWERDHYWQAMWLTNDTEIAHNGEHLLIAGEVTDAPAANELTAGGGRWAGWRSDTGVYTSWGLPPMPKAGCPTLNPDGVFGYVDDRQSNLKYLVWNEERIALGAITDVRASRDAVVWLNRGRTWGLRRNESEAREIQAAPSEFRPIPIDTPSGPWVLNHTQTGIVVRPFGETFGYQFDNAGQTFYPDATYRAGAIVAVFTNDRGVQQEHLFDLTAPRVDLSVVAPPPPLQKIGPTSEPRPADGTRYDLVQFVLGVPTLFPRKGPSHALHQAIDAGGHIFHYVKFADMLPSGAAYETWAFDANWLYHLEDASPPEPYSFVDQRWFPRTMPIGEASCFDSGPHETVFRQRGTCQELRREPFGRRMWVQAVYPTFYWGPDLGTRETLVVAYDPTGGFHIPARGVELFYFARGAGFCRWEYYRSDLVYPPGAKTAQFPDAARSARSDFYLLGGPGIRPGLTKCVPQVVPAYPPWDPHPKPPVPPKPVPQGIAIPYEVRMEKAVAFRLGEFFATIDPADAGKAPWPGWFPVRFDRRDANDPRCQFTLTQPDGKLKAQHTTTGALLSIDATEFGGSVCQQFYGKPTDDRGVFESLSGWQLGPGGVSVVLVEYDRNGAKYASACLTVVEL